MNKLLRKGFVFFTTLSIALFFTSCFHKDVMTDRADDIISSLIYKGKEGNFIICKEAVFQATSKSSNGGFTRISGRNDYRISSYDLATGKLSARINMKSGMEDEEFIIMGATEGKIWMYSINKDLGLHCRDPKTLEVITGPKKLVEASTMKVITLAPAPWSELDRYFAFDWENNTPLITDAQGYVYAINPDNFSAEKKDKKLEIGFSKEWFNTSCGLNDGRSLYLKGDNRNTIEIGNAEDKSKLSFLFGKFIIDNSDARAGIIKKKRLEELQKRVKRLEDSIKAYESGHKDNDEEYFRGNMSRAEEDRYEQNSKNKSAFEMAKMDLEHFNSFGMDEKNMLSNEPNTFLVYYANSISDTARVIISKVKFNADSSCTQIWECHLNNFFFDPDKASSKGAFETVFSKGDPQFRYQWFDVEDNKLIMISQLQMACIDMGTGKVLWEINI